MEDVHQRKRRRLDHVEVAETTPDESDSLAYAKKEISHDCGVPNVPSDEAASLVSETALIRTDSSIESIGATLICYGMVELVAFVVASSWVQLITGVLQLENLPIISIATAAIIDSPTLVAAYLNENGVVQRSLDGACVGKLEDRALQCLFKLNNEDHVEIQFMLKTVACQNYRNRAAMPVAMASAIIYGPEYLSDEAGDFLDRCDYVLQDPFGCEHNVPYKNPHCLSTLFETPRMTFELHSPNSAHDNFTLLNSLQALEMTEDLPEWPQPAALKTELHRHQKQALWFFIMRECPGNIKHIWQPRTLVDGSSTYVNDITGSYQDIPPPVWNGGILADEMGLGKTLQMISLIAADRELQQQQQGARSSFQMATLIVVPLSLIGVWEYQLGCHLYPSSLSWGRHHGRSRLASDEVSAWPDVVLTTYQTVQAEYKYNRGDGNILFEYQWRRIILDEASIIRNRTGTSSAISALRAVSRWAVTGTPIQNSIADIGGLLRFLCFSPYNNAKSFDEDIIEFFRQGDTEEGVRRLKALCQPIMIRRPMSVIVLPPRQDLIKTVEFSAEEWREYRRIENSFQEPPSSSSEAHLSMSTIQLINKLRLFCNLGVSSIAPIVGEQTIAIASESAGSAEALVISKAALGSMDCEDCHQIIDIPDNLSTASISPYAYYSECCKVYCRSCVALRNDQATIRSSCCKKSPCELRPLLPKPALVARNDLLPPDIRATETSKIRALVQEILSCLPERSVVFSFWMSSLIAAQKALTAIGIRCVRIDGTVPLVHRELKIQEFKKDEGIKVILVTISCGGVGLDLTSASRVHLLEPQWNPAIEEQALSRVHRMGQRRPVVTMRYMMKNSIEESVTLVKGEKQLLSELLFQAVQTRL
ncbi:hypothetical protein F4680DRAFT_470751 [Xylaria scruposa]|nr:hypothetical protein F4680DRAFT_470751 [Xylaria scruposa]